MLQDFSEDLLQVKKWLTGIQWKIMCQKCQIEITLLRFKGSGRTCRDQTRVVDSEETEEMYGSKQYAFVWVYPALYFFTSFELFHHYEI